MNFLSVVFPVIEKWWLTYRHFPSNDLLDVEIIYIIYKATRNRFKIVNFKFHSLFLSGSYLYKKCIIKGLPSESDILSDSQIDRNFSFLILAELRFSWSVSNQDIELSRPCFFLPESVSNQRRYILINFISVQNASVSNLQRVPCHQQTMICTKENCAFQYVYFKLTG